MIQYTERLTLLMADIVSRVPTLSFIALPDLLVFARFGRTGHAGPIATCHCVNLPESEPGYYFWRDAATGVVTRRSEWFVTRSPRVTIGARQIKYLISFSLPRFCDQAFDRSRKERYYRRATDAWVAKLDTVIHELYHIDPNLDGLRRVDPADGSCPSGLHGPPFLSRVAEMVGEYLDSRPCRATYDFLLHDFRELERKHRGVTGACFRPYPSFPQRFEDRWQHQPPSTDPDLAQAPVEPWPHPRRRAVYTAEHLQVRQFLRQGSRSVVRNARVRAA